MRYSIVLLALAVSVAACAGATPAPSEGVPSPQTAAELLAAEQGLFAAIQRRDRAALEELVAPHFVLRMPGRPDVARAAFIDSVVDLPAEVVSVGGKELDARLLGPGVGIVSGVQASRVRLEGKEIVDRGAFADVFTRSKDGHFRLVYAYTVSLPEK
jgi:ketosteroid isomerase-like protein